MAESFRLDWDDEKVKAVLSQASFEGLELAAEHLLQVSTELAPLEEGDLARSGEVSSDEETGEVAVSYDRPYAVRQHEELTYRHDEGKQAKYLEDPMHTEKETMLGLAAGPPREALKG